jgi:hypothetical protein
LVELHSFQKELRARLATDPEWAAAIEHAHLYPHVRLLQLMDALSLMLSIGQKDERRLEDVPRSGWDDRVTITWRPLGNSRIVCDPFPFDTDPLEVHLPVRIVETSESAMADDVLPLARLHAAPLRTIAFTIASAAAST